ncbi:unnamed protein product, partial [Rotaria sp. Silwood2]
KYLPLHFAMSMINVFFKLNNTDKQPTQLPTNFTYEDFVKASEALYGKNCCQTLSFIASKKNLAAHDKAQFNERKKFIKDQCHIWTMQRMPGGLGTNQ